MVLTIHGFSTPFSPWSKCDWSKCSNELWSERTSINILDKSCKAIAPVSFLTTSFLPASDALCALSKFILASRCSNALRRYFWETLCWNRTPPREASPWKSKSYICIGENFINGNWTCNPEWVKCQAGAELIESWTEHREGNILPVGEHQSCVKSCT